MRIVDPAGLGATSCECYEVIRDEYDRLLEPMRRKSGGIDRKED